MLELGDDVTPPSSGKSKVRLANFSEDTMSYDFYVSGAGKIDSAVSYGMATPFTEVTAGDNNVIIQDPNHVADQITISPQHFAAGKIYTIMVTGSKTYTGVGLIKTTVIANN